MTLPQDAPRAMERISTGNAQLDGILGGGFPVHSLNILMGEPGSGKSILAEHMLFANAGAGERPCLYLTTLSEPLQKMVRYLQHFDFYDEARLTEGSVIYDSLGEELERDGPGIIAPRLKQLIQAHSPKLIVIDSFKAIHDLSTSPVAMRRMLYDVSGLLAAYATTVFFVGEYSEEMIPLLPEFAVADSIVQLARKRHSMRDERYLRVLKLRGSGYAEGLHAFRISQQGLFVYPRLTSPVIPPGYTARDEKVASGMPQLDAMLGGGLWAGSTTLIQGDTGTGKTTISLQFVMEGIKRGEPALYVNFQENPTQLRRAIRGLGIDVDDAEANGLHLMYASPVELQIDSIVVELFDLIERHDIRRVAIDAVGDLVSGSDPQRLFAYLYALSQHFIALRVSTVMTLETHVDAHPMVGQLSAMCDTILRLGNERHDGARRRTLDIVKARGTGHDTTIRELRITASGADVV